MPCCHWEWKQGDISGTRTPEQPKGPSPPMSLRRERRIRICERPDKEAAGKRTAGPRILRRRDLNSGLDEARMHDDDHPIAANFSQEHPLHAEHVAFLQHECP